MSTVIKNAKPFLKWAGGKTQLLGTFESLYPKQLEEGLIKKYVEPFVGSGAVLFDLISKYKFEEVYINDINPELINTYRVIKNDVNHLIEYLSNKQEKYLRLEKEERKEFYYSIRDEFNNTLTNFNFEKYSKDLIIRAGQFIFLNRTCFNGLFRVNRSGYFNVPMGDYKQPTICDVENLLAVSKALENVVITLGDYRNTYNYIDDSTFVYFDPPYRPLNATSSFTSYSKDSFNDENQKELSIYFRQLNLKNALLMLSNSDPKNVNESDNFFDILYNGFNIYTVYAKRMINSKADKRGNISELVITNY